jgi:hypothetical protein
MSRACERENGAQNAFSVGNSKAHASIARATTASTKSARRSCQRRRSSASSPATSATIRPIAAWSPASRRKIAGWPPSATAPSSAPSSTTSGATGPPRIGVTGSAQEGMGRPLGISPGPRDGSSGRRAVAGRCASSQFASASRATMHDSWADSAWTRAESAWTVRRSMATSNGAAAARSAASIALASRASALIRLISWSHVLAAASTASRVLAAARFVRNERCATSLAARWARGSATAPACSAIDMWASYSRCVSRSFAAA